MQTDRIDVLTTQLAETDRRALSQAWYSALHLAERTPPASPWGAVHYAVAPAPAARWPAPPGSASRPFPAGARAAVAGASRRREAGAPGPERRAAKTALARRVERALAGRSPRAAASFVLRDGGGRIRLVMRSDGARTRLFAVCAPAVRERVERALAQARFALAGRGVHAEVA